MQTAERPSPVARPPQPRVTNRPWWRSATLPGCWGAVMLGALSLTPSLLPRGPIVQGLVTGITSATGYGLGVLTAAVWRAFADRDAREPDQVAWRWFFGIGLMITVVALALGERWQGRLRTLMSLPPDAGWRPVLVLLVASAAFLLLWAAARGVGSLARRLITMLDGHIGQRAARALGWLVVTVGVWLVLTGLVFDGLVAAADRAYSIRDAQTVQGLEPPESSLRSGGPDSLLDWNDLGRQGRNFVASGPSTNEIQELRGGAAAAPIRAYAGMASANDVENRARMAVDDLERAGGFSRDHLLVATTTGTGWLDGGTLASFEYLTRGDAATVSMQYSYLPSVLSYLVDQPRARQAGRALFDVVYERWSALPPDSRPRLYVFGESLGSFGAEAAFSGEFDLSNRVDGALFVGPPNFNTLHDEFTRGREAGSPQVEPVYRQGRTVRFANEIGAGAAPLDRPWDKARVLYLQHPSDPIVWWTPELILRRPDWLAEPPGRDVLDEMVWLPFITFWQVTADLPFALDLPDGHGHRYTAESVDAWSTVLRPDDWDEQQADRLRARALG